MRLRSWISSLLFILLAAPTLAAEKPYILSCPGCTPDKVLQICKQYGLKLGRRLDPGRQSGGGVFGVTDPSNRPSTTLVTQVETTGAGLSLDALASLPESKLNPDTTPILNPDTTPILSALSSDPILVDYYGATVWDAYVTQQAAQQIQILEAHQFLEAHQLRSGGGTIAVIDTGIDPNHPAFADGQTLGGRLVAGKDFTGSGSVVDLNPDTVPILAGSSISVSNKVAVRVNRSTVAAIDQAIATSLDPTTLPACLGHGTGVAGVALLAAPDARVMPLKAFDSSTCTGPLSAIIAAIYYAADNGASVINMSFSMDVSSDELQTAISYANSKHVICVASVGNDGQKKMVYPAGNKKVAGVASTDNADPPGRSVFSNYGDKASYAGPVNFAAPGECVIAPYPDNNWACYSGTSFSAPFAAGGAGLLLGIASTSQEQAVAALSQALPIPNQGMGAGRINLYWACQYWAQQKGIK